MDRKEKNVAKVGIGSFLLDCHTNDNIAEIEAEYGIKGFAVIVRLWQKIYSENGYYCEWIERSPLLFLSNWFGGNSGVDINLINNVVSRAIKIGIFNESMFSKYAILTSEEIQEKYFDVVKRRKEIVAINEYLLVSVDNFRENVCIISKNVCKNQENVCRNSTSKVKESKAKESNNTMCKAEALSLFERLWPLYPNKKGKGQVSDKAKLNLLEIGYDEMVRAIDRYKTELEKDKDWRSPQNGSTFFTSGYIDYLDTNYVPSKKKANKDPFCNFPQREYDYDVMEKLLLERS